RGARPRACGARARSRLPMSSRGRSTNRARRACPRLFPRRASPYSRTDFLRKREARAMTAQPKIDRRVLDLYDEYCHGRIDRREFLARASALAIGGASALAMAQALFPRYAEAMTVSFTDSRIKARYVEYPSPGGTSGEMRGYLVQPTEGNGPFPAV